MSLPSLEVLVSLSKVLHVAPGEALERVDLAMAPPIDLTDAPLDVDEEDLEDYDRIEIILDGVIGLAWLQRPLEEEELEMMRENGWPPVLRRDFLSPVLLTEDDVLEIGEIGSKR